ncbi:MAG: hypothetical protein HY296_00660 [Thaumarchaeota archaeon]|nr:hypothetical protein [Nitrososphaerota archaeon]
MLDAAPAASVLRPLLDQYRNAPVGLFGCHSVGLQRQGCELDVLVITEETERPTSVRFGDTYADIMYFREADLMAPASPEFALAISTAKPIRDNSLAISTAAAASAAMSDANSRKSAQARLSSAVKALGRADESLGRKAAADADFWLLRASYDFAFAWLYSGGTVPAPSHILRQLRDRSAGASSAFEAFSKGSGLQMASKSSCSTRLEGISLLHDALRSREPEPGTKVFQWSVAQHDILKGKAEVLISSSDTAGCYAFLGLEAVNALDAASPLEPGRGSLGDKVLPISKMTGGKERILGERLVAGLGLARSSTSMEGALRPLKDQVAGLAKTI